MGWSKAGQQSRTVRGRPTLDFDDRGRNYIYPINARAQPWMPGALQASRLNRESSLRDVQFPGNGFQLVPQRHRFTRAQIASAAPFLHEKLL
jgi:hypothetical protein